MGLAGLPDTDLPPTGSEGGSHPDHLAAQERRFARRPACRGGASPADRRSRGYWLYTFVDDVTLEVP